MTEQSGMSKQEEIPVVPIGPGEAHLQNEITSYKCYVCGKVEDEDMVLIRTGEKQLSFACLDHEGVVQDFLRQFRRVPLGWVLQQPGEDNDRTSDSGSTECKG